MHHSHLCGEGGDDAELIYMQGECKVCSLLSTLLEQIGLLFLMFPQRFLPDAIDGNERCGMRQCAWMVLVSILTVIT